MQLNLNVAQTVTASLALILLGASALCLVGPGAAGTSGQAKEADANSHPELKERFFELRTYTAAPGKLDALHKRFREHTNDLFKKHGMTLIGFWTPANEPRSQDTLIYILAYSDLEAREKAWKEFQADPDWQKAKAESEKDGPLLARPPESVYMKPTDFSPMK